MPSPLSNLSPQQRQILMIGAPAAAVFALVAFLGKRNSSSGNVGTLAPSTGVVGVDQLSEFENSITEALAQQGSSLDAWKATQEGSNQAQQDALSASLQSQGNALQAQIDALHQQQVSSGPPASVAVAAAPSTASSLPSSVASPANPAPGSAHYAPNPVPGDTSKFVVGTTTDGNSYSYGGSADQAAALVAQTGDNPHPAWYGTQVNANDPNVPQWYKMGFSSEEQYKAIYG